jgi:hypothetical protein
MSALFIGNGGYDLASRRIPLLALKAGDCRFPVNDPAPGGALHLFCGLPQATAGGSSYCEHHRLRCSAGRLADAARSGRTVDWNFGGMPTARAAARGGERSEQASENKPRAA